MARTPLIVAGLVVVLLSTPAYHSFGSARILDLTINPDGSTHIYSEVLIDSANQQVDLFGPSIDNLVAQDSSGSRLPVDIIDDKLVFDSALPSKVTINYDIHDLVSKQGRIWTFSFDSPSEYSLLMPENSVIVGMSTLPVQMEADGQVKLDLPSGSAQIDYVFGVHAGKADKPAAMLDPLMAGLILGPIIAAGVGATVILKKRRPLAQPAPAKPQRLDAASPEAIFDLRPDMREDDKEIVKFIYSQGGQALESDLRKEFLQPRTTMWRAVKRLERLGVVGIHKKDQQNMVKLKDKLEEID